MNRARRAVGLAVALSVTAWFMWYATQAMPAIDTAAVASPAVWGGVVVAAISYALVIPVSGWAWAKLLRARGECWSPRELGLLMGRTQLAKYIPGNVAQHALRFALALRAGMPAASFISSVVWETVLAVAASVIVGLVALGFDPRGHKILVVMEPSAWVFGALLLFLLPFIWRAAESMLSRRGVSWAVAEKVAWSGLAVPLFAYIANYILIGFGLYVLARALALPPSVGLSAATCAFALSWALGFLAPGAPAGLGVREGLMVALLQGTAHSHEILVFVLLARVATIAGDGLCFVIAWVCNGHMREVG